MADTKKAAMSRALGAAFLNHQVEQLEKSYNTNTNSSTTTTTTTTATATAANTGSWRERRPPQTNGIPASPSRRGIINFVPAPQRTPTDNTASSKPKGGKSGSIFVLPPKSDTIHVPASPTPVVPEQYRGPNNNTHHDADVIVVDASVLIHALYQVRRWCRDGRSEIVIVPLEALNTLDLLKKGTSVLAQRARAASRILEAQVGTNPRIRVQRDDAFVPWGEISFNATPSIISPTATASGENNDLTTSASNPEWLRRTICCARYELVSTTTTTKPKPKVILAVLASTSSPAYQTSDTSNAKFEPRSTGALVSYWASRAGVPVFEVAPTDEDHVNGPPASNGNNKRVQRRSPPREKMTDRHMVERPAAVMALMGNGNGGPTKVLRVLARGEKLDLDLP